MTAANSGFLSKLRYRFPPAFRRASPKRMQEYLLEDQSSPSESTSWGIWIIPDVSTQLDHDLWLMLCDQVGDNLPLVIAHIHQILLRASIVVNCLEHAVWRAPDTLNRRVTVHKVQQFDLSAVVELVVQC